MYQQLLATPAASNQLYSQMAEAFRGYLKLASPGEPGYKDVVEVVRLYYERMKA